MTIDAYFSTGPAHERRIYEAVQACLDDFEDVYTEPVSVGIFFKRARVFVRLRPMQKWLALGFVLPRKLDDTRLARKVLGEGSRFYHVVNLRSPDELDDTVRGWLAEAYLSAE